jgi:hypothetical protein
MEYLDRLSYKKFKETFLSGNVHSLQYNAQYYLKKYLINKWHKKRKWGIPYSSILLSKSCIVICLFILQFLVLNIRKLFNTVGF